MASKLLTIAGANGNYPSSGLVFGAQASTIALQGTFDGNINIEASYDDGANYIGLTDSDGSALNISTDSIVNVSVGNNVKLRFVLSGSSGSNNTDVDVYVA
jgi:hypothetical protein